MRPFSFTLCLLTLATHLRPMVTCSPYSTQGESSNTQGNQIGAAYFMTNEPSGNYIISSAIGADGKLFAPQHIATGGIGASGLTSAPFDPIFSQGAIMSSPNGILAATNPGSDTVSLFNISESNPASLELIGSPVWTQGEFPVSLAFNNAGDVLCVLNSGFVNGVSCFNVDKTTGLSPISNTTRNLHLNLTTPPLGPIMGSASQVIFSEDNKQLLVIVKGVVNTTSPLGFLAVWDVDENNVLSQDFDSVPLPSNSDFPFSITVVPGRNAYLVTDSGLGFDIFSNVSGNSNGGDQRNIGSYAHRIPNQVTTCWSAYSSRTGNYYLADLNKYRITEVNLDENLEATIVNYYPTGPGPMDTSIASIEGKDFLYQLVTLAKSVEVHLLDGPGKAERIQRYNYTAYTDSAGIKINGANLAGMATFLRKA